MDKKNKNRLLMPKTAKLIDWIRSEIPDVKVLYAEEGQYKVGSRQGVYVEFKSGESDGLSTKPSRSKRKIIQNDVGRSQPTDEAK